MHIGIISLLPEMFDGVAKYGVLSRIISSGTAQLSLWNPRDYALDTHRTVDDRPYGGGPGMLMKVQPLRDAIGAAKAALPNAKTVYLSPQGKPITQRRLVAEVNSGELILVCGRYEGIDERVLQADIDEEWSLGDFVLSGGEIAAMAVIDACLRILPGALGNKDSAKQDSFSDGLLECPQYTRPELLEDQAVPDVLLSGNHQKIARWREQQSLGRTWQKRPDLLSALQLTTEQQALLAEYRRDNGLTDDAPGK